MSSLIGKRIKSLRDSHDETQGDTANAIGITAQQISNIERGYTMPKTDVLVNLAKHFDSTTDFILGLSAEPERKPYSDSEIILISVYRQLRPEDQRLVTDTVTRLLDGIPQRRFA